MKRSTRTGLSGLILALIALAAFQTTMAVAQPPSKPSGSISVGHIKGEVLVKFRKGASDKSQASAHTNANGRIIASLPAIGVHKIRGRRGQSAETLIAIYSKNPNVEFVEPNILYHSTTEPNDTRYPELWGMNNTGQTGGTPDADIDAPEAWDITTGSAGVIVADIDSGVDYTHVDLKNNIWENSGENIHNDTDDDGNGYIDDGMGWDFVNNDNDPMDDFGHGTHTAGTFAAEGNNSKGVVGVSWSSRIMPLKFLNAGGTGSSFDAASAVLYASAMGAKVSSNSWGCGGDPLCYSQTLKDAIDVADTRGMLFVASAGNDGAENDSRVLYPCNYTSANVLCVAATDHNDAIAGFSNYGSSTVDLAAPGVGILSTVPKRLDSSGYLLADGTSMATPHVAGAAALILSQYPDLTPAEVKDMLISSVDPVPALAGITVTGGRLNAHSALTGNNFTAFTTPSSATLNIGESTSTSLTLRSLNGFSAPVYLSVTSSDFGITASLADTTLTLPADGTVTTTLTIDTAIGVVVGVHEVTVAVSDGDGESHSASFSLDVTGTPGITVTPSFRRIPQTGNGDYTVTVDSLNGNTAPVTLSLTTDDAGLGGSFNPNPVTPPAGGSVTSTLSVSATGTAVVGNHVLTVEGDDGIDYRITTANAEVVDTDLIMTQIGTDRPTAPAEGTLAFQVSTTILNQALISNAYRVDNPEYPFYITIYLSEDATITTSDIVIGVRSVSKTCGPFCIDFTLSAGESQFRDDYVDVPDDTRPGIYYVGAIADAQAFVPETDTTNNAITGPTIEIINTIYENMDLVMTNVSGPATAELDSNITIAHTVHNQGTGPSDRSMTGLYLSVDPVINYLDTRLAEVEVAPLSADESRSFDTTVTIPATLAPGTYYIAAIADWRDWNAELDETNNVGVGNTIEITAPTPRPDLVMTELSGPRTARQGSFIDVSVAELNQGIGAAGQHSFQVFLSTDPVITTEDISISAPYIITQLAPGESFSSTLSLYITTYIVPGDYYLGAIADVNNDELEEDETNNALVGNRIRIR